MLALLDSAIGFDSPESRSLLIDGDRIALIASRDEVLAALPAGGKCIELRRGILLPGFQDAHIHLYRTGCHLSRPDLSRSATLADALEEMTQWARTNDAPVLIAEGFDESAWPDGRWPTKEELDRISDRPLIARRVCLHVAVANSAALARIERGTRYVDHETGIMEEDAVFDIDNKWFPLPIDEQRKAILLAQKEAFARGITTVHEIDSPDLIAVYRSLESDGKLKLRIRFIVSRSLRAAKAERDNGQGQDDGSALFSIAGAKEYLDGSIGGRSAALNDPYDDGSTGGLLLNWDHVADFLREADEAGVPVALHAIGDRTIDGVVRTVEEVSRSGTLRIPVRIEHAEMLSEETAEQVVRAGIRLCMQPNFAGRWGRPNGLYEDRLGKDRAASMNRCATWIKRGIPVAFGSDGMPMDPLFGIQSMVNHPNPGERMNWQDAYEHYSQTAEEFVFPGGDSGRIETGKRADLNWFDRIPDDPGAPTEESLRLTIAGGRVVHER